MLTKISTRHVVVLVIGIVMLVCQGGPALAQTDDSDGFRDRIHLRNGDVITGGLRELDRGKLRFRTRTMDTVYINWVEIESIESDKYLRIGKADGSYNYGTIQQSDLDAGLIIEDHGQETAVPILSVSTIQRIRSCSML